MLNFRTDNKIALVTGCSSGIGMAIAIELAQSGADIIGVSNDMPETGSDVSKAVEAEGRKFYPYVADFSKRDSLYAFLNKVKAEHPRIDIIINNVKPYFSLEKLYF
jgi:2-deoxy-D-gluconate 3-dehydrogenase